MQTMHLFAGIGGGLLADRILGHDPIIAVEWDRYACQALRERAADGWFPNLRVWEGDVRLFDPSEYAGQVDCIHAGFPCQDISVAGNQAGVGEETRSGLYREVIRIARILRPRFLYLENVSAIVSNGLGTVVADLAALGYDVEWLCLRASDCGAPHHRDRWWCLAHARHEGIRERRQSSDVRQEMRNAGGNERNGLSSSCVKEGQTFPNADSNQRSTSCMGQDARADGRDDVSGICEVLADAEHAGQPACAGKHRGTEQHAGRAEKQGCAVKPARSNTQPGLSDDVADTDSAPSERNKRTERGEPERTDSIKPGWWDVEPNVGRVANGIPNRIHRLKGLGNAQVPLQAAAAFSILMDRHNA